MVSKSNLVAGGGVPGSLRKVHRALALRELWHEPGMARVDLAARLGLSSMAVGRIVRELSEHGLAGERAQQAESVGRGRPPTGLQICPDGAYVVGAVISAFAQEIHLFDLNGKSIACTSVNTPRVTDGPVTMKRFCRAIRQLIRRSKINESRVAGVGLAIAASVDTNRRTVLGGGYLGWSPFDLANLIDEHLGLPFTLNNIADALLRAESFCGCARSSPATVLVHSATILGSSYFANGSLLQGANFGAGKIGHFPIRSTDLTCSCGGSDCLNCSASGWAILHRLGLIESPQYRLGQIQQYSYQIRALVNRGGESSRPRSENNRIARAIRGAGAALAVGLRYLDLTLDPDRIVLAGPLSLHPSYFSGITDALTRSGDPGGIGQRLVRGEISTARAAGIVALLDTVFTPALELNRFTELRQATGEGA